MSGTQKQSQQHQSQSQGTKPAPPGEDPGTLIDEEDAHPDSPLGSRRDRVEDPKRSGGAEDHSNSM
jgi:hypothetical protein